ncbi:MAG: DoxX family membrane protein, partial [Dehalococcoidia bacterium]|nr:DoxX family membrane protein [Dehalococcoidia bacterium]
MHIRILTVVSFAAAILLGLILIASGTGKLFGDIETSSQVMAFVNDLLPEALLVPPVIYFIYNILVPYLFPIAELILGLCMLFGLVPALAALISLPLMLVFMATNIWALTAGGYETCAGCFGLWEEIFGHLSPAQSLIIDIFMIVLALLIIFMRPGRFFYSRQPVSLLFRRGADTMDSNGALRTFVFGKFRAGLVAFVSRAAASVRYHTWAYAGFLLGIVGVILSLLAIFNLMPSAATESPGTEAVLALTDNVTVTEISHDRATVNFTTAEPEIIDLLVYDRRGSITGTWSEDHADRIHFIEMDNLAPATTYYLQILFSDRQGGKNITQKYEFSTTETPPAIFDVIISGMTENSVSYIWETDRPTIAEVTVVQMDTMDEITFTDEQLDTFHYMKMGPLTADKDYSFSIRA